MNERAEALEDINQSVGVLARSFLIECIREHHGMMPLARAWSEHRVPSKNGLRLVGFEVLSEAGSVELLLRYDGPKIQAHLPRSREDFRGLRITILASLSDGLSGPLYLFESSLEDETARADVSPLEADEDVRIMSAWLQQEAMTMGLDALGYDPIADDV